MALSKVDQAERDMEKCQCRPLDWIGRITTAADDGTASVVVCSLMAHRDAAERWVRAIASEEPRFIPWPDRQVAS